MVKGWCLRRDLCVCFCPRLTNPQHLARNVPPRPHQPARIGPRHDDRPPTPPFNIPSRSGPHGHSGRVRADRHPVDDYESVGFSASHLNDAWGGGVPLRSIEAAFGCSSPQHIVLHPAIVAPDYSLHSRGLFESKDRPSGSPPFLKKSCADSRQKRNAPRFSLTRSDGITFGKSRGPSGRSPPPIRSPHSACLLFPEAPARGTHQFREYGVSKYRSARLWTHAGPSLERTRSY